jgi:hypothetical protein
VGEDFVLTSPVPWIRGITSIAAQVLGELFGTFHLPVKVSLLKLAQRANLHVV